MPSKIVRCGNCGDIVEADPGTCSSCGAPLRVLPSSGEQTTSYAEKYKGTEFDETSGASDPPPVAPPGQNYSTLLIGLGVALVAVIVAVSALLLNSAPPAPTARPQILSYTHSPSPEPTAVPILQIAYSYITSPVFAANMTVHTDYLLDARVNGVIKTVSIDLTAKVNGPDSQGHYAASGSTPYDFVCVGDLWYTRTVTSKKWSGPTGTVCKLKLFPLFGISAINQLKIVGEETVDGQHAFRVTTTNKWSADVGRLTLMSAPLPLQPDAPKLDIWVNDDGEPIKAFLAADYNSPADAKRLLTLETTYTFADVGIPVPIASPK